MDNLNYNLWLGFGIFCILSEFLLPGMVMVFLGLGALTVALGIYLGYLDSITFQLMTFFISSIVYLIPLRFLVLRFVPTNIRKVSINEDDQAVGVEVEVIEDILPGKLGRIEYSESTWQAKVEGEIAILKGQKAKIIGRDNITWIVQKI
jgi:membrane protein implicated in regulation of membrane protease activity